MNEKYLNNFKRMIQAETVSIAGQRDLAKFRRFHALLAELFPSLWACAKIEELNGSLLIKWQGSGGAEAVLLMNHHDVVEENGEWKHAPFAAETEDGKLYGRGTVDTKSGLWAMLQAADRLAEEGFVPRGDIYFESACDEEISGAGADAFSKLLERRGVRFALVLDEGRGIIDDGSGGSAKIGIAEKGCTELKFTARSEGGHASRPPKNSALVRLGRFMARLEDDLDKVFPPAYDELVDCVQQTSIAFTMAQGSKGRNVLPREAYIIASMRSAHHQGVEASIRAVGEFAAGFDIEVEILDRGFSSDISDTESKGYRILKELIAEHFGLEASPFIMAGATDARYMSRVSDCCLRFSPFRLSEAQYESIHAADENIDICSLESAVEFFRKLIVKCCGVT